MAIELCSDTWAAEMPKRRGILYLQHTRQLQLEKMMGWWESEDMGSLLALNFALSLELYHNWDHEQ